MLKMNIYYVIHLNLESQTNHYLESNSNFYNNNKNNPTVSKPNYKRSTNGICLRGSI